MRMIRNSMLAALLISVAASAQAQDADPVKPFTIGGSASLVSQYRFRGISRSDEKPAIQGAIGVEHRSGLYTGAWASSLDAEDRLDGADAEIDLYGGYRTNLGDVTVDAGLIWYLYPGSDGTDVAELYGSVTGELGPVAATLGLNYAPDQQSIGSDDNVYLYADVRAGIINTPVTLKARLGYSNGGMAPDGAYFDWLIGADLTYKSLTFGIAYVDTSIDDTAIGKDIADAALVVSMTAAF